MQVRLLLTRWFSRRKSSKSQATSPATTARPDPFALPKEFEGNQQSCCHDQKEARLLPTRGLPRHEADRGFVPDSPEPKSWWT